MKQPLNKGTCRNIKVQRNNKGFVTSKWCNRCYDYLNVESFDWDETREGYLQSWCRECTKNTIGNKLQ